MNELEKEIKQLEKNIKLEPKILAKLEKLKAKCEVKDIEFDGDMQKYHLKKLKAKSKASIKLSHLAPVIEQYEAILEIIEKSKARLAEINAKQAEINASQPEF